MDKYLPQFSKMIDYKLPVGFQEIPISISWKYIAYFSLSFLHTVADYHRLRELGVVLIEDLYQLKNNNNILHEKINTFSSYICSYLASRSMEAGEIGDTFDWIKASVRDEVQYNTNPKEEISFSTYRIIDIMRDEVLTEIAPYRCFEWLGALFYYAARYGGHVTIAEHFEDFAFNLIKSQIKIRLDDILISFIKRYSYYLTQYERPQCAQFSIFLYEARKTIPFKNAIYCQLTFVLSTRIAVFAKLDPKVFAIEAVKNCKDNLTKFDLMQVAGNALSDKTAQQVLPMLMMLLRDWRQEIVSTNNLLFIKSEMARLFPNIGSWMVSLATIGANKDVIDIFREWAGSDFGNYLLVFVSYGHGVIFVDKTQCKIAHNEKQLDNYVNLANALNSFLKTSLTVRHKSFKIPESERLIGAPTPKLENQALQEQVMKTYAWKACPPQTDDLRQMVVIPAQPHPNQSIMLKELGWTLPLSASFAQPKPDRNVAKVLILKGDSNYTDTEIEIVINILRHTTVKILDNDKYDLAASLKNFDPDVIWVLGHGEYDHYSPQNSKLHTCIEITLAEFAQAIEYKGDKRRLLFMNICSGGTPYCSDSPALLGIGPTLASSNIAILSHLWDIQPLVATVFGCLLADSLNHENTYFAAFCKALENIQRGRSFLLEFFNSKGHSNLVERIYNSTSVDFDDLSSWGSPVFWS